MFLCLPALSSIALQLLLHPLYQRGLALSMAKYLPLCFGVVALPVASTSQQGGYSIISFMLLHFSRNAIVLISRNTTRNSVVFVLFRALS